MTPTAKLYYNNECYQLAWLEDSKAIQVKTPRTSPVEIPARSLTDKTPQDWVELLQDFSLAVNEATIAIEANNDFHYWRSEWGGSDLEADYNAYEGGIKIRAALKQLRKELKEGQDEAMWTSAFFDYTNGVLETILSNKAAEKEGQA